MAASKAQIHKLDVNAFAEPNHWRTRLLRKISARGEPGAITVNHANVITALEYAPEWTAVLAFNEFSQAAEAVNPTPWGYTGAWSDVQDIRTAEWMQHQGINAGTEIVGQSVQKAAESQRFHPVREYLGPLRWDGKPRIESWLHTYLGATANEYTAAVGARWMRSGVARIFRPGVKADCCLILEGPQGSFKSTAIKTIAGEFFTDEIADLGSKDSSLQTRGVWIIEIAELDSMTRGEVSKTKAFMSRGTDRFRPPYGKRLIESPRQCIFAGSVNHSTYLRDETGGRRFWPVQCGTIRIDELARDRDQLWAEAAHQFNAGAPWWLDTTELNRTAEEEQAERYIGDPWDELIQRWIGDPVQRFENGHPIEPFTSTRESLTITDILAHCIGKRQDQWTQSDKNRVSQSLQALGWERYRYGPRSAREWRYRVSQSKAVSQYVSQYGNESGTP